MHGTASNTFTSLNPFPSQPANSQAAATSFTGATTGGGPAPQSGILATLIGLTLVYIIWGLLQNMHAGVREEIQPRNIAHNVHNFITITLTVVIGLVISKIVVAKLAAWGVPGMTSVATVVDAA